ncbi:MAG: hypothetical protein AB8G22_22950 [Saprospiraceae bacterium]
MAFLGDETIAQIIPAVNIYTLDITIGEYDETLCKKNGINTLTDDSNTPYQFVAGIGDQTPSMHFSQYEQKQDKSETKKFELSKLDFTYCSKKKVANLTISATGTYDDDFKFTKLALTYDYKESSDAIQANNEATWGIDGEVQVEAYGSNEAKFNVSYHSTEQEKKLQFSFDNSSGTLIQTDNFALKELDIVIDMVNPKPDPD